MKAKKSILASFFALLVLAGSTSFSVGIHLCGNEVKALALLSKAEGCAHSANVPPCHRASAADNCCSDEVVTHEGSQFKSEIVTTESAATGFVQSLGLLVALTEGAVSNPAFERPSYRSPPVMLPERTVLFRTFLI